MEAQLDRDVQDSGPALELRRGEALCALFPCFSLSHRTPNDGNRLHPGGTAAGKQRDEI